MKDQLKLNKNKLKDAMVKVSLLFERDTGDIIKQHNIWRTGDLWGSIEAFKVQEQGDTLIGGAVSLGSKIGKKTGAKVNYAPFVHDGAGSVIGRPFFDWALKQNNDKYDRIIMRSYQVDIV